jgi:molybdate/tungstate transport system substrate-binding protein
LCPELLNLSGAMKKLLYLISFVILLFTACGNSHSVSSKEIIIFHAGSLSVPFRQLKNEYEKKNPGVNILLEPSGSLVCARKVTELKKECDIIASADYLVIDKLLIPDYASWNIRFATNEIVIAYSDKSRYSSLINADNWMDILSKDDVVYARSDPDSDPCGYRTVITFKLAEKYYNKPGLTERMLAKDIDFIRPKEVDLIALIESNSIDYMFQYKSVAIQHGLKFIALPDDINLSDPAKEEIYNSVSMDVTGDKPGTKIKVNGDYINYSITILNNAPHKDAAIDFLCFMLSDEGMDIFRKNGQDPIIPPDTQPADMLPIRLSKCIGGSSMN